MEDRFGTWRTIGPKWLLQLDILQQLLVSIRVLLTFLLVIFIFPQKFLHKCGAFTLWANCGLYDCFLSVVFVLLGIETDFCPCLIVVLFQALLHHCFVYLLWHIAVVLEREISTEFTTTSV